MLVGLTRKSVEDLFFTIWMQALKDYKADQTDKHLYEWLINEGRTTFAPHLTRGKAVECINEYLSR